MNKVIKPERLDVDPGSTQATAKFNHWFETFTYYLDALQTADVEHTILHILINLISFHVYQHIADINGYYDRTIQTLKNLYIKFKSVETARHELRMYQQHTQESLDQFVLCLEKLSKECECKNVPSKDYPQELMPDDFIAGMTSDPIRQHLLENRQLTFQQAY